MSFPPDLGPMDGALIRALSGGTVARDGTIEIRLSDLDSRARRRFEQSIPNGVVIVDDSHPRRRR